MNLNELFESAAANAECGNLVESAELYTRFLEAVHEGSRDGCQDDIKPAIRSAAFNLAQVLNKLAKFETSLQYIEIGLCNSPTPFGRAVGMVAKGEALCGLGRDSEGEAAFREAVIAHPIVGRLNAADSMTRIRSSESLATAEEYLANIREQYWGVLNDALRAEAMTIHGKLDARRGNFDDARRRFLAVLQDIPNHADAKRQLQLLDEGQEQATVQEALRLSREYTRLPEAIDLMERIFARSPEIRRRYEGRVQLWRRGITM